MKQSLHYKHIMIQAITSSGTKKGEFFLADVNTQLKRNNITTDINVDTNSNWWFHMTKSAQRLN
ncbi:putative porin, eukaryotic type [Helianthus annuus]|nr:putative porin, eukaryotic type [Helianthus annuus]KAJ0825454.1 putative porin, eukaryotic type [Helianthus annuus]